MTLSLVVDIKKIKKEYSMKLKTKTQKIYFISGKAQHGKDSVARVIAKICEERDLKHINLQYGAYLKDYAKKIYDWDGREETKPRTLLQHLATEVIRNQIDELFFVKRMCSDLEVYINFFDVITISDTRHKVEIDIPREKFSMISAVSVVRPNFKSPLTKEQQHHKTELDLDDYDKYDHVINNDGTLEDLDVAVRAIIEPELQSKKKISHNELRNKWNDFWKEKDHEIIPSASLIPLNDPTLLWINAGIAPLKKYFDGTLIPDKRRLAGCQKCLRTSDISNVGNSDYHATFFEMLGNFSIGDYFKKEAITWSWEFLTSDQWLGLDKDKIYVTIYPSDEESYEIWKKVGLTDERILRLDGNFWEIGTGPSGPCSEIFYDRGKQYDPDNLGTKLILDDIDNNRYLEIWNNVFSMYNAIEGVSRENYKELPSKNIDTGMGIERILTVLQDVESIFETDLFIPLITYLEEAGQASKINKRSLRIIADHLRAVVFALSDGANFGNSGRDYVLRRLLRRSIRHGKKIGLELSFTEELVPTIVELMKEQYPILKEQETKVIEKIKNEEKLFHRTLIDGEKRLTEIIKNSSDKTIKGEEAFKLYDTYGFPFELTEEIVTELGYSISKEEFDESMRMQQELARASRTDEDSMHLQNKALINFKAKSEFIGYTKTSIETKIIGLYKGNRMVGSILNNGYVVLEKTPFYAESGGQISDKGTLEIKGRTIEVLDLFKGPNNQTFHYVEIEEELKLGDNVIASVNDTVRLNIKRNHSAAHLLQKVLQEVLGINVKQAGSKIDDRTLRFDFTYDNKISDNELIEIEKKVNEKISLDIPTKIETMTLDKALKKGAIALFEEKYSDQVRVVTIADSVELCGGTHVDHVSEIEKFAIKSIETKGNNIYRIEATTGSNIESELFKAIKPYNDGMIKLLQKAKRIIELATKEGLQLKFDVYIDHDNPTSYNDVIFNRNELEHIKNEVLNLEKEYNETKVKDALSDLSSFESEVEEINNIKTIIIKVNNYDLKVLKEIINNLSNKFKNSFLFIANIKDSNVNFIAKTNEEIVGINCGELVKEAALKSKGKGSGSKTYAQGGGTSIEEINNIIEEVKAVVKNIK